MVDEKTRKRWKKEDTLEEKKRIAESYVGTVASSSAINKDPGFYGSAYQATPSGSAYPGKPDVDMKFKGWVAMFGDHFLCEVGCKRFADKSLDKVLRFIEKEIRHWYHAREVGRAIKSKPKKEEVEVRSYLRKPRKKKETTPDNHEEHIKANIEMEKKLGIKNPTNKQLDKFADAHIDAIDKEKKKRRKERYEDADGRLLMKRNEQNSQRKT